MKRPINVQAVLLVLALAGVLIGCSKEKSIVGRWTTKNSTSYYFREDSILFYRGPSGRKFQGVYTVDKSTSPMTIRSHLVAMDGGRDTVDIEFKASFVTANRLQLELPAREGQRKQLLARTTEADLAKAQGKAPPQRRGPIRLPRP